MDGIKHSGRFAELERLMDDYFRCHIVLVMSKTQTFLSQKQGEELKEYSTSLGGIISMMASSGQPLSDPYQTIKLTGEWNSKTTEDYIGMCKEEITDSKAMQQDLAYMASQWRETVVQEVGRERYDELSGQLGCDLAYAYMDYRVEQLMIDRLVQERMPKSSADYIIRKAAESSLLGLSQTLNRSPLAEEIEARGEAAYRPSKLEKGTAKVLGASADAVMLGGAGSWATLAKFVGADVAITAVADHFMQENPTTPSVEQCISKGVFGSERNVFEDFRREAAKIPIEETAFVETANEELKNKIPIVNTNFTQWMEAWNNTPFWNESQDKEGQNREERYKDVPLVVAPGHEEAYLRTMGKMNEEATQKNEQRERVENGQEESEQRGNNESNVREDTVSTAQDNKQTNRGGTNGWDSLIGSLGLDGMGDIGSNLGYVIAMLPDMLLGAFTGKTKSLRIGDNLLPIASIVAGLFVRNPLLKMLLVGLGGANLLNKAGQEALADRRMNGKEDVRVQQYRRYEDEPLNPRIVKPMLQGSTLIATIDRVPCTIQLSPTIADAYHSGALPLNTLANAVLAKSDQLREAASLNYEQSERETIVRTRGIQ